MESTGLDELDFRLVTALQVAPRAQWQQLGRVLGIDGSTASRRWSRLVEQGLAWLTCYPLAIDGVPPLVAHIEVDCAPGRVHEVSGELALDSNVLTLEHATGARDLLVTAVFFSQESAARYIGFRLGGLDGVVATRSQLATNQFVEASRWRLDRASRSYADQLGVPRRTPGFGSIRAEDLSLVTALAEDCRQSVTALAERLGTSPATVHRRLARLEADHAIAYRCEVARFASGWPLTVTFWGAAPLPRIPEIGSRIAGLRETRMCCSLTGPRNLVFTVWLRAMAEVSEFEMRLQDLVPELEIADRAITLWVMKIGGHLLDPAGRHLGGVPLGEWHGETAAADETALVDRLRAAVATGAGHRPRPIRT
ncbi:Lrp/AsnC family transcriptional regulator [Nocardia sp. IFM 10818]